MRNFRFFGVQSLEEKRRKKKKSSRTPEINPGNQSINRNPGNPALEQEIQSLLLFRVMPLRCDALMLAPIHNIHNKAW